MRSLFASVEHDNILGLPTHIGADLLSVVLFGIVGILLVAFGLIVIDYLWKKLNLQEQVERGNVAAGIVKAACILGLSYYVAQVIRAIIG